MNRSTQFIDTNPEVMYNKRKSSPTDSVSNKAEAAMRRLAERLQKRLKGSITIHIDADGRVPKWEDHVVH